LEERKDDWGESREEHGVKERGGGGEGKIRGRLGGGRNRERKREEERGGKDEAGRRVEGRKVSLPRWGGVWGRVNWEKEIEGGEEAERDEVVVLRARVEGWGATGRWGRGSRWRGREREGGGESVGGG